MVFELRSERLEEEQRLPQAKRMGLGKEEHWWQIYKELESLVSGRKEWGEMVEQKPENIAKDNTKEFVLSQELWDIIESVPNPW